MKPIAPGEVLAGGEAVDNGIFISKTYSKLLQAHATLMVLVDSTDLFMSPSTCGDPEDKSFRADLEVFQCYYETKQLRKLIWIPGSTKLADPLTKRDGPPSIVLQLMVLDGTIQMNLEQA